jgi:hypothetical protein
MQEPPFPPPGQTSICSIIPSYLYEQYFDDEDLQAFITTYNQMAQLEASWFCDINLPIYTQPQIAGDLLDWVAEGIYGFPRPTLSSGGINIVGPLNTWMLNTVGMTLNTSILIGAVTSFATTDDIYKRLLTFLFYKGDGFQYTISWLKRRMMRFLTGPFGIDPPIANTVPISVVIEEDDHVLITITVGGAIAQDIAEILQAAMQSAWLGMPFQYHFTINLA